MFQKVTEIGGNKAKRSSGDTKNDTKFVKTFKFKMHEYNSKIQCAGEVVRPQTVVMPNH